MYVNSQTRQLADASGRTCSFWATVCKTVRPMLSDRCLSVCPNCLSVTLVYCGKTVGWIKVKLGMQVGLGPGHIVSDGDPAPPPKKGHIYILRPVRPIWPVHGSYTGRCSRCVVYTDRDRQTDIQRTDSIGRTVLQTVAQKPLLLPVASASCLVHIHELAIRELWYPRVVQ